MLRRRKPFDTIAAVDLGSNSFHMIVARVKDHHVHVVDRLRETVRLANGLDEETGRISEEALERALACLERFGQRVRSLPQGSVRAVGTNTLRQARKVRGFQERARKALGHPIEIIAGLEEARLIYLGVAHSLADDGGRRLVVDIGGGSTELIIGERFEPQAMESLYMGCINMGRRYFSDSRITERAWRHAEIAAQLELQPISARYRRLGWERALGASGTLLAIERILREQGWAEGGVTHEGLLHLRDHLLGAGHFEAVSLKGLSEDRRPILAGGAVVLLSIFESLGIQHMQVADGALREGLIYELLGRIEHEDVRTRSIEGLVSRFQIDDTHARQVEARCAELIDEVAEEWELNQDHADLLSWAARLHELGLNIAHAQYHKHGAYILENADLAGFTVEEQRRLALLVRGHRRKFPLDLFEARGPSEATLLTRLAILLRLSIVLNRGRSADAIPIEAVTPKKHGLKIRFAAGWLDAHPLTRADLEGEAAYLSAAHLKLKFE